MKRKLEEWEAAVADAVRHGDMDEAIAKLDSEFLFAETPDKLRMLQTKYDLVKRNEEKVAVLDQKFDLVERNAEKVAVLDQKFRLAGSNEEKVAVLDQKFDLVERNEEKVAVLDQKFRLAGSNEEKVAVLDQKFRLAGSNEEKVAVLDQKFRLAGSNEEKVAVLDQKFRLAGSNEEKVAVLDQKFDLVERNEEKVAVLDQKFRLAGSNEEKVAVLDQKFDLVERNEEKVAVLDQKFRLAGSNEEKVAVLDQKLGVLRIFQENNNSRNLLESKIELIAQLAPLVADEHREALHQESKRASSELDILQPLQGMFAVYVLSAELQLRAPTDPCLFRSVLWKRIKEDKVVVFGTCDRSDGKISIRFMVTDIATRTRLADILQDVAKQCESAVHAEVDLEMQLAAVVTENVEVAKLAKGWKYVRQEGSPGPRVFVHDTDSAGAAIEVDFADRTRRRASSSGSSSSGQQNAHILFKGSSYDAPMLQILASFETAEYEGAQCELQGLQSLTYHLEYRTHQDYDNFRFFYAWKFSQRSDGGWALVTQPRFMEDPEGEDIQLVRVSFLSPSDRVKWRHALALRKALTIANRHGRVDKSMFKRDWESDVSACWME